jgi:hypothetical protein
MFFIYNLRDFTLSDVQAYSAKETSLYYNLFYRHCIQNIQHIVPKDVSHVTLLSKNYMVQA